jgi:hypothetical protein
MVCQGGQCTVPGPSDGGTVDGGPQDGGAPDGGVEDGGTPQDGGITDGGAADGGGQPFGERCGAHGECESQICLQTGRSSLCTRLCSNDCPGDYVCKAYVIDGNRIANLCTPFGDVYCVPCTAAGECPVAGDQCTDLGGASYCTRDCSATGVCPPGFECRDVPASIVAASDGGAPDGGEVDGGSPDAGETDGGESDGGLPDAGEVVYRQCLPVSGTCPGCADRDGDRYGIGADCLGPDCDDADPNVTTPTLPAHCGACGRSCINPHGTTSCVAGDCVPTCATDYGDCDGDPTNGCETDLRASAAHCGGCGLVCRNPHGTTSCEDRACAPFCDTGFDDCDGDKRNGCETDLGATLAHCGACGVKCENQNGSTSCEGSQCRPVCTPGFHDCNGNLRDGCEADLSLVTQCGGCAGDPDCPPGFFCKQDQAPAVCKKKKTLGTPCAMGPAGQEGRECESGFCVDGVCCQSDCPGPCRYCALPESLGLCSLVPSGQDPRLACPDDRQAPGGNPCGRDGTCDGTGACRLYAQGIECEAQGCTGVVQTNAKQCDGFGNCVAPTPSSVLCVPNACFGNACATGCGGGQGCAPGFQCVGTVCESSQGTPCTPGGTPCASGNCVDGFCCDGPCSGPCEACDIQPGTCLPVPAGTPDPLCPAQSVTSCGRTGLCKGGTAECQLYPSGAVCTQASCSGSTLIRADLCSGAGVCIDSGTQSCSPYTCDGSSSPARCKTSCATNADCALGYSCCSGVCRNLNSDPGNCGLCGRVCQTSSQTTANVCLDGTCTPTCATGWGNCDGNGANGCERSLRTLTDCNGCNASCDIANASESCATGTCSLVSCNAGFSTCDGSSQNGCEVQHSGHSNSPPGEYLGAYNADAYADFLCPSQGCDFQLQVQGTRGRFFNIRAVEGSDCPSYLSLKLELLVPAGIDYDLYATGGENCGSGCSSLAGTGQTDTLVVYRNDNYGSDDSFNVNVEVRFFSGASCTPWTLRVYRRRCAG